MVNAYAYFKERVDKRHLIRKENGKGKSEKAKLK